MDKRAMDCHQLKLVHLGCKSIAEVGRWWEYAVRDGQSMSTPEGTRMGKENRPDNCRPRP